MRKITDDGLTIELRVKPGAKRTAFDGLYGKRLKVKVSALPQAGKANKELIDFIAKEFDINKSDVNIIRGQRSRDKTLALLGNRKKLKKRYDEIVKEFNHGSTEARSASSLSTPRRVGELPSRRSRPRGSRPRGTE